MHTHTLSIIVPCYNEAENISLIVQSFISAIGDKKNIEVILVNNGSTDNSADVLEKETKANTQIFKTVEIKINQGYGNGILKGLEASTGSVIAWTHADMQTDPSDVLKAFRVYEASKNPNLFIKGKRLKRKFLDAFFTFGMQIIAFVFLKTYLSDINAQPKMFSRDFYIKHLAKNSPLDFSLDLYALYMAKKFKFSVVEIPVVFAKRHAGVAKGGGSWKTRITLIQRTLKYIACLQKN